MSQHRDKLRAYFMAVVKDFVVRGEIRRQNGQSLEKIMAAEAPRLWKELQEDTAVILLEVGVGAAGVAAAKIEDVARKAIDNLAARGVRLIAETFKK